MEDEDFDFSVMGPTGGFAVEGMEESPLAGASLFDSAAESIRAARLGPMAQQAGGAYASQAGGLHSLVDRLSARKQSQRSPLARRYAEGGEVEIDEVIDYGVTSPQDLARQRASALAGLERRYAQAQPSDSEKWLSVAAALLAPTETGRTSESLAKALGAYGQYAGEKRKYGLAQADQAADLTAKYDIAGGQLAARMAAAQAAATRANRPKSVIVDSLGKAHDPMTGEIVLEPPPEAWAELEAEPTAESYASFIETFPRFADKAELLIARAQQRAMGGQ